MDKYGKATPEALAESALWEASLFAEHDFDDIKISVKHHDPVVMVRAYELLAEQSRLQTPVARFAATHSTDRASTLTSQLIPLSLPKPGEQNEEILGPLGVNAPAVA